MTLNWIDGKILPAKAFQVWAEIKDGIDGQHYYATCYYTNMWWKDNGRRLNNIDTVIRYFRLPTVVNRHSERYEETQSPENMQAP